MSKSFVLSSFLQMPGIILDVRSPSEYEQGHIPGSYSLPLFSNEERAQVGTTYKQVGRLQAIDLGLEIINSKLITLLKASDNYLSPAIQGKLLCWRGGMRSGFIAHLLATIGFSTLTLQGGYRSFRHWTLTALESMSLQQPKLRILGGLTGSGKTTILQSLAHLGEQVIDLEKLASHRGSVFGMLNLAPQPSQEQFENHIAFLWNQLDLTRPIWIEDESRLIGKCRIPSPLLQLMHQAPLFFLNPPVEERIQNLMHLYGQAPSELLVEATNKIAKRLGGELTQQVIKWIYEGKREKAAHLLLTYYDKSYQYQLKQRSSIYLLKGYSTPQEWAHYLKNYRF